MDEALKPCPFCRRSNLIVEHMDGTILHPAHRVRCDDCGACSRYTDRDFIAAWNTRADAAPTPKADEVEAVARAIEDQLTAEDGWMVGTPALSSMCHDFAQATIAALDAARGDPVARLIAHMKTIEPDEETAGCPATWADFIQILEGIAEAGEPFNG